ncbi:hypothetical protein MMIC_P1601 [Mariprofundus micogutta]|uniref:YtkA-like domain-containing protein n=1 Tax=Mariprofundus micogutta TaxID=1921010 RepID=A0A1L8CP70_9PROT|nr:hypothetical protein [Mariprofundus micogutta]GAV20629.1 hypothetical protein MMIC_P1601 [Mariprofundus micogutta]
MFKNLISIGLIIIGGITVVLFISTHLAMAADSERHKRVNGMDVYLGVIPSQLISRNHSNMHAPRALGYHEYHVIVALFDSKTGSRITDATVRVNLPASALTETSEVLEIMQTNGVISYGNFFRMTVPGKYRIKVMIERPEMNGTDTVYFIYQRPRD